MALVHPSLKIKLIQNKGKRYKQYNLSHTKKNTSLCCQDDPSHFRFRPHGFVVVVVHHLVKLCEARNDRDADLCLQEALKFQLHRCHINLRRKNHFRRMNSALNYSNSHLSLEPPCR